MSKEEKRTRKIYCKILNAQREGKVVSLYEDRPGKEVVKLYDIQENSLVCLFQLNYLKHPTIKIT